MFSYTVALEYSVKAFDDVCSVIDRELPQFKKRKVLADVDGSLYCSYSGPNEEKIDVQCSTEIDAVFIDSSVPLPIKSLV